MTVRSEGDVWVMERPGAKEEFEAELRRLGFRDEDFVLSVRRAPAAAADPWSCRYAVRVTSLLTGRSNFYWAERGGGWVTRVVQDLAEGFFGRTTAVDLGATP